MLIQKCREEAGLSKLLIARHILAVQVCGDRVCRLHGEGLGPGRHISTHAGRTHRSRERAGHQCRHCYHLWCAKHALPSLLFL